MNEWKPIETAPKDGTLVLLFLREPMDSNDFNGFCPTDPQIVVGWWDDDAWGDGPWNCGFTSDGSADTNGYSSALMIGVHATHWMPLPPPPEV